MGQDHLFRLCRIVVCMAAFELSLYAQMPERFLRGQGAFGDWKTDSPGTRRLIKVEDLPQPYATPNLDRGPKLVKRPEAALPQAPPGFSVRLFAEDLKNPRKMVTAPNGDLLIAESAPGRIRLLRQNADGTLATNVVFAEGLRQPFGIAFLPPGPHPKFVYVANTDSVIRFDYQEGDLKARGPEQMIVRDIPGGGRLRGGGHWTRDIVFTPDGKKMFVSVGSHSNVDDDPVVEKNRADILEYNSDGTGLRLYASGIRNAVGLALEPSTGQLWASVNERDGLGDDLVPDYITHVQDGGFYGWPWYYLGSNHDPRHAGKKPELASKVIVPDVLIQSHSASLCMTFYSGSQFPPDYRGNAFAAQHGSWNREKRTGYKVIRVPVRNGKASGEYVDFLTGFVTPDGDVWGRPVGVAVDRFGALMVTDDGGNRVWRVAYEGSAPH